MPDPSRIVVVSPNWLGDAVMALPAIADLRRRFGSAHLAVAARASVAPMFELAPGVDAVVTLRWKGRVFDRTGLRADAAALRDSRFDTAVLLPNSMASAWLVRHAGVPERWGYATDYRSPLLTRAVPRPKGSRHQARYYQHLTEALGVPPGPLEPVLTAGPDDVATARTLLTARGWDGERPLVALAPGAAYGQAKRWPPERYAALVSSLVSSHGATCVLVGAGVDAEATRLVRALAASEARPSVIDLANLTTLRTLAGVLALAGACVSNDSGAMHLAAAVGVRVVALFGPTREKETAPLARAARPATILIHDVFCRPCMLRECPIDHRCMTGLDPARVQAAVADAMRPPA
jgi:heptosyltransferase II